MQTMKQVLASFVGEPLDATFDNGVITLSVKPGATAKTGYPRYVIQEVGTDVFKMTKKGSEKASGIPRYYRIDKVLVIGLVQRVYYYPVPKAGISKRRIRRQY